MKIRTHLKRAARSFFPTTRNPWGACQQKLGEAKDALGQMEGASDRVAYEDAWLSLVDSLEVAWTRFFGEGKTMSTKFQPWAGEKDSDRRSDPCLRYLIESRHKSQHGGLALVWEEPQVQIAPGFTGHIRTLEGYSDGLFVFDASSSQDGGEERLQVVLEGGAPSLPDIENRGVVFSPPEGISPIEAARSGIDHYERVFVEAAKKFMS